MRERSRCSARSSRRRSTGSEQDLPGDLDSLAYLYVRLRESILYADLLSGRSPDPEVAERAVRALLTAV